MKVLGTTTLTFIGMIGHAQAASVIDLTVNPSQVGAFSTIGAAAATEVTGNNYIINVAPGTYVNDFAVFNAPTVINGAGVTIITTQPPPNGRKGVFSSKYPLAVNGVTFIGTPDKSATDLGSGISASQGGDSAAISESSNGVDTLTIDDVTVQDFQTAILTGSDTGGVYQDTVTISNSVFMNNGNPDPTVPQSAITIGDAASLTITNSMISGQLLGYDVSSLAAQNSITGTTLYVGNNAGAFNLLNTAVNQTTNDTIVQGSSPSSGSGGTGTSSTPVSNSGSGGTGTSSTPVSNPSTVNNAFNNISNIVNPVISNTPVSAAATTSPVINNTSSIVNPTASNAAGMVSPIVGNSLVSSSGVTSTPSPSGLNNSSPSPAPGASDPAAVPEPSTFYILSTSLLFLIFGIKLYRYSRSL